MLGEKAQEKCAAELKQLAVLLEPADRRAAMQEYNVSYITISRYLCGQVANLVLGINLLNFFKNRLRKREQVLNRASNKVVKLTKVTKRKIRKN
jgi:hypothetical protein